jgi:hypothetical protein
VLEDSFELMLVNARHVKQCPRSKRQRPWQRPGLGRLPPDAISIQITRSVDAFCLGERAGVLADDRHAEGCTRRRSFLPSSGHGWRQRAIGDPAGPSG